MSYLDQLQKSGTMSAVEKQTRQFNSVPRTHTHKEPESDFQGVIEQLQVTISEQKNKFDRFLTINQNRMMVLEKEVNMLKEELSKKTEMLSKLSDRETVERSREALFNRKDRALSDCKTPTYMSGSLIFYIVSRTNER